MLPTQLSMAQKRMALTINQRGSVVIVEWRERVGGTLNDALQAVKGGTEFIFSGNLMAVANEESPRNVERRFAEVQTGDLILDVRPDPTVALAAKGAIADPAWPVTGGEGITEQIVPEVTLGNAICNGNSYLYAVSALTSEGETALVSVTSPHQTAVETDKALLIAPQGFDARVRKVRLWRNRDEGGSDLFLLAEVRVQDLPYLDTENHAAFSARIAADAPEPPVANTTAVTAATPTILSLKNKGLRFYHDGAWYTQKDIGDELRRLWAVTVRGQRLCDTILLGKAT
jgi:hypothetical protein